MATPALVSVSEYLDTTYRPDQELLDGILVERNVGDNDHSRLQRALVGLMFQKEREWSILGLPEQRIRVSATRYRIPDVCVISLDYRKEPVLTTPPLVCIEVPSKDDTLNSLLERIDDYRAFGVSNIWVLDPAKRRAYVCQQGDFREALNVLEVQNTPIRITLIELFAYLD